MKRKRIDHLEVNTTAGNTTTICTGNMKRAPFDPEEAELHWKRCKDGFDKAIITKTEKSLPKRTAKGRLSSFGERANNVDIDISWSSSDNESLSDIQPLEFDSPVSSPVKSTKSLRHIYNDSKIATASHNVSKTLSGSRISRSRNSNHQVFQVVISDYESSSDDDGTTTSPADIKEQEADYFSIPTPTPTPTPSISLSSNPDDGDASPRKGSDFVKLLKRQQLISPDKTEETPTDSATKKNKFVRGGLADKLHKLVSRERSSISMWKHRMMAPNSTIRAHPKAINVQVMEVSYHHGVFVCLCVEISQDENVDQQYMHVLFSAETAKQWQVAEGSTVTIYPPWQRLNLPTYPDPILLCTYYCQCVSQMPECQLHTRSSSHHVRCTRRKMSFSGSSTSLLTTRAVLEEVTTQETVLSDAQTTASDSFLDSIAESSCYSNVGMYIRATVQRVCCAKQHEKSDEQMSCDSWLLILQDIRGVFCELLLPVGCHDDDAWKACLDGEGKTFIFKNVKVLRRTCRSRSVRLFSLLDSLWPPKDDVIQPGFHSQSQSENADLIQSLSAPSFCYTFTLEARQGAPVISNEQQNIYKSSPILKLIDACRQMTRASMYGRVCYVLSSDSSCTIYITDQSLQVHRNNSVNFDLESPQIDIGYRCLRVEPSCAVHMTFQSNHSFMFKDVHVEDDGTLRADSYSRIMKIESTADNNEQVSNIISELRDMNVRLQALHRGSREGNLVSVLGNIVEVEESSAFHWPACRDCLCDKLHVKTLNGDFYCETCKKTIDSPAMNMFLVVYIECQSMHNSQVKLQLRQSTIESILPPVTSQIQKEGFDLLSIMGKQIGPINCIVREVNACSQQFVIEELDF